jgi:hypothetical protein
MHGAASTSCAAPRPCSGNCGDVLLVLLLPPCLGCERLGSRARDDASCELFVAWCAPRHCLASWDGCSPGQVSHSCLRRLFWRPLCGVKLASLESRAARCWARACPWRDRRGSRRLRARRGAAFRTWHLVTVALRRPARDCRIFRDFMACSRSVRRRALGDRGKAVLLPNVSRASATARRNNPCVRVDCGSMRAEGLRRSTARG